MTNVYKEDDLEKEEYFTTYSSHSSAISNHTNVSNWKQNLDIYLRVFCFRPTIKVYQGPKNVQEKPKNKLNYHYLCS